MSLYQAILTDAARLLGSPVAILGFLDDGGERIEAAHGWNVTTLPPASSFARRLTRELLVVNDASKDPRLGDHPLVTGAPHLRFYAGAPILVDDEVVGALSVLDRQPRTPSPGQIEVLRILARHVSRELELRAQTSEANERFREFFENTDDLVMSIGSGGELLHANETALRILGITRGTSIFRVMDADTREPFRQSFETLFFSGEPQRVEATFVTAEGRRITVEGSLRAKFAGGRPYLARVVFRDISDRKQFEMELGNARDAALEAARLKTQFLTNVSHEIRTPMNGIVGMVDLLLSTRLDAEQQDFAHQARASAEQLLAIVNNILYVSAIEAGSVTQSSVDFDLLKTLQRIVEVMKIASLGKDLDVRLEYDDALPPIFRGNQAKIRQAVTNLLDNAVKFTEQGEVVLRVMQQTETETHRVLRFEISDTGIGISAEDRLLLFERFSQIEASSTRRYQGVGLGLATARQLVETMGGLIDCDSKPGFGSTFWFTVPFAKHPSSTRKPVASSDLEFKGKRVLLADRLPTSRKIVRHYLETTWGMHVDDAQGDLLAALKNDAYRVVVFDAEDPVAFAKAVRSDPSIAAASLIWLTPPNKEVNDALLREAGVNAHVSKPVGQADLFDAMTIALAQDAIPLAKLPSSTSRAPVDVSPEVRKSIRVLLAEDNFLNMKLTMSQLQKLGYVADSVGNGKEALEALEKNGYQVVLMDCQMPIVDGYQATMETRRREKNGAPRRYIIAMTANALEGHREKCLAAGMDDYLAKPTKAEELEAALGRYFERMGDG